jgi:hypothetical protein
LNHEQIARFYDQRSTKSGLLPLQPTVNRDDVSDLTSTPAKSLYEVSDFGDRGFHKHFNSTGGKTAPSVSANNDEERLKLQDIFFGALVKLHDEKKGFFPRKKLSKLVTKDCVLNELTRSLGDTHSQSQIKSYAQRVCDEIELPKENDDNRPPRIMSFKKIFVILVMIQKTSSISKFIEEGVTDLDLPIGKRPKAGTDARIDLRLSRAPEDELQCFHNWTQFEIVSFEEWQWTTISPFFHKGSRKDVQHFCLPDSAILPFTFDSSRDKKALSEMEGGYGRVFEVNIHEDHHEFDPSKVIECFPIACMAYADISSHTVHASLSSVSRLETRRRSSERSRCSTCSATMHTPT